MKIGKRLDSGRCSECDASGFTYETHTVRGYRCMTCGTIKPEQCTATCRMDASMRCNRETGHKGTHESKPYPLGPKENGGRWQFGNIVK